MFLAILRRAQIAVDQTIGHVVNRAIVSVPFLVAFGFATAALAFRLNREFGPETSNLMLAGGFLAIGLLTAIVVNLKPRHQADAETASPSAAADDTAQDQQARGPLSQTDKDLLVAALTSAAPIALPGLLRILLKNLPLLAVILTAIFVMTRQIDDGTAGTEQQQAG